MTHHAVTLGVKPCLRVECKFWLGDDGLNGRSERPAIAFRRAPLNRRRSNHFCAEDEPVESMQCKKVAVETTSGQHVNSAASPGDLHKLFEQALNSGDLDALVALYASDGFLMARSGPARGISEIRKALAEYVAMKPTIQLTTRRVVQVGAPPCLWQIGDFTEPPAMAEMYQPLAPVSKSLVANRTGVGVTSSTFPTGSVNPLAEN